MELRFSETSTNYLMLFRRVSHYTRQIIYTCLSVHLYPNSVTSCVLPSAFKLVVITIALTAAILLFLSTKWRTCDLTQSPEALNSHRTIILTYSTE